MSEWRESNAASACIWNAFDMRVELSQEFQWFSVVLAMNYDGNKFEISIYQGSES